VLFRSAITESGQVYSLLNNSQGTNWIGKYTLNGTLENLFQAGIPAVASLQSFASKQDGTFLIGATVQNDSEKVTTVFKVADNGTLIWQKSMHPFRSCGDNRIGWVAGGNTMFDLFKDDSCSDSVPLIAPQTVYAISDSGKIIWQDSSIRRIGSAQEGGLLSCGTSEISKYSYHETKPFITKTWTAMFSLSTFGEIVDAAELPSGKICVVYINFQSVKIDCYNPP
jgi:hypothetical protein